MLPSLDYPSPFRPMQQSRILGHLGTQDSNAIMIRGIAGCKIDVRRSFSGDERNFEYADDILGGAHGGTTRGCETNIKDGKCV
jgi:hypothetical protein